MQTFSGIPIKSKLTAIIMLTTCIALLLSATGFIANEFYDFRRSMVEEVTTMADIVGINTTAALTFNDDQAAKEILTALSGKTDVISAYILTPDGNAFAHYSAHEGASERHLIENLTGDNEHDRWNRAAHSSLQELSHFWDDHLDLYKPVTLDGDLIGLVLIQSDLETFKARLYGYFGVAVTVLLVSLILAYLLSSRLQRVISEPILHLAATMKIISEDKNVSIRVVRPSNDELGVLYDGFNDMLSEIHKRDAQLVKANIELQESNRELDDFAHIASHDLREPLRGIHNYSAFLLEDYGDKLGEDGRLKLETLERLTQRMDFLIEGLLYYARVGHTELAFEETDLNGVLADVLESLRISIEQLSIGIRVPRPLPVVRCNRSRVAEIFRNLISNAMKYNDKQEKWIEIGMQRPETPDAKQVFYVRDNGIGIRKKHLETIFRIFKRLHVRDKYGVGTGAGLTIVRKIVERHGGRIWVESTVGEGSTFFFTLEGD